MDEISTRDVRRLFLESQGLIRDSQFGRGKNAALRAIEQLGYVQIDTIAVMDRAHHHVLKTRVPNYSASMLDRLQWPERKVFEYWAHAAAYLPMADYRFYRPMMDGYAGRPMPHARLAREIFDQIRDSGPMQSKDFENTGNRGLSGWWDWKPAKQALESLFLRGELMVSRREGFQKVFDLPERVLPPDLDTTTPSPLEWYRFIALKMIRALGAGTLMDIAYARTTLRRFTGKLPTRHIEQALNELSEEGDVVELISGSRKVYATPQALSRLPIRLGKKQLWFLSPFDNLVINRRRAQWLFNFDYQIECYVPAPKRVYGYYCLPILWGDELIGRLDAKAVRNHMRLEVRNLQLEPRVKLVDPLITSLAKGLEDLAHNHGCTAIEIAKTDPATLREVVLSRIS